MQAVIVVKVLTLNILFFVVVTTPWNTGKGPLFPSEVVAYLDWWSSIPGKGPLDLEACYS